ncbi:conserved hypothetical protein [Ahrensia sp. R2A130]|nr:conserved hypothetical protein [Ahrensia sp. R2A130]
MRALATEKIIADCLTTTNENHSTHTGVEAPAPALWAFVPTRINDALKVRKPLLVRHHANKKRCFFIGRLYSA